MNSLTRRRFLIASGVTGGAALAAGATAVSWNDLMNAGRSRPLAGDASVLVLVTLYGGNDGLNTVIPAGDHVYQDSRPDLAYAEHEVLPLGEGLGLNPSLKGFKSLWDSGRLAIVRGVSYPKPDHSHFRSMAIWQTASPVSAVSTGWLGRWLDSTGAKTGNDPLLALSMDPVLPVALAGEHSAAATLLNRGQRNPAGTGQPAHAFTALAAASPGEPDLQARVASSMRDLLTVDTDLLPKVKKVQEYQTPDSADAQAQGATAGYQSKLAQQLGLVRACVTANVPTRVYSVSLGGFDTHTNERNTQSALLGVVDKAVSGFLKDMASSAPGRKVVVAIYSEFGRRVAANANEGTDHGTAGPMFIAGQPVAGGFYGEQPSLNRLQDGDLIPTVDFRDVYATLLHKVLNTDPASVLGPGRQPLAFL